MTDRQQAAKQKKQESKSHKKTRDQNGQADTRRVRTVLVSVARPDTAARMLELAVTLIDADDGRVIALTVAEGDSEETNETLEFLQPVVQNFIDRGYQIEMVTQLASSVTRGILDATREYRADLLIVGVAQRKRQQVRLGPVVENLIEASTCDMLIYRMGPQPTYDRVLVTVDGSDPGVRAVATAVAIAKGYSCHLIPLYIQRDYIYRSENEKPIRSALSTMPAGTVEKDVVPGSDPAERILQRIEPGDLLVLGFKQGTEFERELRNNLSNVLLNRAPGSVVLASRMPYEENMVGQVQRQLQRLNPALTETERNEIVWRAQQSALASIDYSVTIVLSAVLASLGLLLNSSAVIIGAMLVAPLMTPLAAFSIGLVTGLIDITRRAAFTVVQGTALALLFSAAVGVLLPISTPTSEMLLRGSPTLLDAGVAVVSGWVAAFATARKEIPAALAGVAIAAALVPPISTVGLGLAVNRLDLAAGAGLLFLANILFIVVAQYMVLLWLGMRPGRRQETAAGTRLWWGVIAGLMVVVIAVLLNLTRLAGQEREIEAFLRQEFAETEFVSMEMVREDGSIDVDYVVRADAPLQPERVAQVEERLADFLNRPQPAVSLELIYMQRIRPETPAYRLVMDRLQAAFPAARVDSVTLTGDNPLQIDAVVSSAQAIDEAAVRHLQTALREQLGQAVRLTLQVERVITAGEATAEPEATAPPDAEE